jgi:polyphosphate glucokinase
MVEKVRQLAKGWSFEAVALGYPGLVGPAGPREEPGNLGKGWVGFDFAGAIGVPVKVLNDAVMQALGSYDGGRMLFLGLGTGLGSALVSEKVLVPLELGRLPFRDETIADYLGKEGRQRHGNKEWQEAVGEVVANFKEVFLADYVMLGGGKAKKVDPLPAGARRGGNENAFEGGFLVWETAVAPIDPHPAAQLVWKMV